MIAVLTMKSVATAAQSRVRHQEPSPDGASAGASPTAVAWFSGLDDSSLVAALRNGSPGATAVLFDRYASHVQRVLLRVMGADGEVQDLVHDVFVQALSCVHQLTEASALKAWLTSIAIFVARGCIRRRKRRSWLRFFPAEEVPEIPVHHANHEVSEALKATYQVFERLPVDERIPLALRLIEGMDLPEIASACGVSLATIKRRIAKAEERFLKLTERDPVLREWTKRGQHA